jgi:hypothetical protein
MITITPEPAEHRDARYVRRYGLDPQGELDERIDAAIAELRAVDSPVTSANVADFVTDQHPTNAVDDSILWRDVDAHVRERFDLASDAEEITIR